MSGWTHYYSVTEATKTTTCSRGEKWVLFPQCGSNHDNHLNYSTSGPNQSIQSDHLIRWGWALTSSPQIWSLTLKTDNAIMDSKRCGLLASFIDFGKHNQTTEECILRSSSTYVLVPRLCQRLLNGTHFIFDVLRHQIYSWGAGEKEQKSHEPSCSIGRGESWVMEFKAKAHLHMAAFRSFRGGDHLCSPSIFMIRQRVQVPWPWKETQVCFSLAMLLKITLLWRCCAITASDCSADKIESV